MDLPEASSRPSRLSLAAHIIVVGSLGLSFISGVLIWYGQSATAETLTRPAWLHAMRVTHGCLNPVLCAVFGYLVCQHIRYGWALRTNWPSGLVLEVVFVVLIGSALLLYYADEGRLRRAAVWTHQLAGAVLPLVVAAHWIASRMWLKKVKGVEPVEVSASP